MNTIHTSLIDLLNSVMNDSNLVSSINVNDAFDWNSLYQEAYEHQVHTLIYPVIATLPTEHQPDSELMERWRTETLKASSLQLQHIQQISMVLAEFHRHSIPVIALKGLILRSYYPNPELRIMGDADLFIHKDDVRKAEGLLKSIGYHKGKATSKHISYTYQHFPEIELHWALTDSKCPPASSDFNDTVWDNAVEIFSFGTAVSILSYEDQFIHLILHSINHILSFGFGLRQLCDLTLFTKANAITMDWNLVIEQLNQYHIQKFAFALLIVCNKLFQLEIPPTFKNQYEIIERHDNATSSFTSEMTSDISKPDSNADRNSANEPYITLLMNEILDAGVYGRKLPERTDMQCLIKYISFDQPIGKSTKHNHLFSLLFPSASQLGDRYGYAKRYPILLPIAWVHRAAHNVNRVDQLLPSRMKRSEKTTMERYKLLRWLQLR